MGNSYSVVREEQEEEEFRRLVEAVEIAQQRSTRQADLESGLKFLTPFLGPGPNATSHVSYCQSLSPCIYTTDAH